MLIPEQVKEICISSIEIYLNQNKIEFEKIESASGSTYYILNLWNGRPKIRVSDHSFHRDEDYKLCSLSINYVDDFGKHSNPKKIKVRVQAMINKLINYINEKYQGQLTYLNDI